MSSIRHFLWVSQFAVLACLLVACSGAGLISGSVPHETQLTNPPPSSGQFAQPVNIGQPAPGPDPTSRLFYIEKLQAKPLCKYTGKDLYQFRVNGFIRITDPNSVPEMFVDMLSMGSLRAIDTVASKFTDVPLTTKMQYSAEDYKVEPSLGYFDFQWVGPSDYSVQFYLMPPKSTKAVAVPWSPCPASASCVPDPGYSVIAKTASGKLEGLAAIVDPVGSCDVGAIMELPPQAPSGDNAKEGD